MLQCRCYKRYYSSNSALGAWRYAVCRPNVIVEAIRQMAVASWGSRPCGARCAQAIYRQVSLVIRSTHCLAATLKPRTSTRFACGDQARACCKPKFFFKTM